MNFTALHTSAYQGNKAACLAVGRCYRDGVEVAANKTKAAWWFFKGGAKLELEMLAATGFSIAATYRAELERDRRVAVLWHMTAARSGSKSVYALLKKLAYKGDIDASFALVECYERGIGGAKCDREKAFEQCKCAALYSVAAKRLLGEMYLVRGCITEGVEYLTSALKGGDVAALYLLKMRAVQETPCELSLSKYAQYLFETGKSYAACVMLYNAVSFRQSEEGGRLLSCYADHGNAEAMFAVALINHRQPDRSHLADAWFYKAAIKGHSLALTYLTKRHKRGVLEATKLLGQIYVNGTGVRKDLELGCNFLWQAKSLECLRALADQNIQEALYYAGLLLQHEDKLLALHYLSKVTDLRGEEAIREMQPSPLSICGEPPAAKTEKSSRMVDLNDV